MKYIFPFSLFYKASIFVILIIICNVSSMRSIWLIYLLVNSDTKVTEIFCLADDFCIFFDSLLMRYSLNASFITSKREYYCSPRYLIQNCVNIYFVLYIRSQLPETLLPWIYLCTLTSSFSWVNLLLPLCRIRKGRGSSFGDLIKKVLLGKCTGISFVDSTTLRVCRNQCIQMHKVFKGISARGKSLMGWFLGIQATP